MSYKNQVFYKLSETPTHIDVQHNEDGETKAVVYLSGFGEKLSAITCDFPKGFTWAPHSHPHEQLTICISGSIKYTIGEKTMVMHPGDTAYLKPNVEHVATCLENTRIIDVFTPVRLDQMSWYDDSIKVDPVFNKK